MKLFDKIRIQKPRLNKFDLSHERKMSLRMGELIPILVQDIVPGDSFRVQSEIMMRFAPLLAPIMHRVNVTTHYFFVPNRLVWDEWEDFITGGPEGTTQPVFPHFNWSGIGAVTGPGTLSDFMGLPVWDGEPVSGNIAKVSMLPFRAYQLIYNEYYRDQNLQEEVPVPKTSGQQAAGATLNQLLQTRLRAWEKDYFTSALPWAQRGVAVEMPVDTNIEWEYKTISDVYRDTGAAPGVDTLIGIGPTDADKLRVGKLNNTTTGWAGRIENIEDITADGAGFTINDLRRSIKLQEWLEKNARGGARYIEQILSHFGVVSSDARLQRPEYLGGGKSPVVISEVLSTYQDPGDTGLPQANMAGHGISVGTTNGFKKSFEEHGYVIGIMSVLPKTAYQQGIPRHFSRETKFDYYWPEFAHLGEQEVKLKELYYSSTGAAGEMDETFGYQSRYAEYKYIPDSVHGEFRSSLAFWHMGRIFESKPSLNAGFVQSDPTTRIFAVQDASEQLYTQIYNRVSALRPMPYFGTPMI